MPARIGLLGRSFFATRVTRFPRGLACRAVLRCRCGGARSKSRDPDELAARVVLDQNREPFQDALAQFEDERAVRRTLAALAMAHRELLLPRKGSSVHETGGTPIQHSMPPSCTRTMRSAVMQTSGLLPWNKRERYELWTATFNVVPWKSMVLSRTLAAFLFGNVSPEFGDRLRSMIFFPSRDNNNQRSVAPRIVPHSLHASLPSRVLRQPPTCVHRNARNSHKIPSCWYTSAKRSACWLRWFSDGCRDTKLMLRKRRLNSRVRSDLPAFTPPP